MDFNKIQSIINSYKSQFHVIQIQHSLNIGYSKIFTYLHQSIQTQCMNLFCDVRFVTHFHISPGTLRLKSSTCHLQIN